MIKPRLGAGRGRIRWVDSESDKVTSSSLTGTDSQGLHIHTTCAQASTNRIYRGANLERKNRALHIQLPKFTSSRLGQSVKRKTPTQVYQCTKPSPWTNTQKLLPWCSWYFTQLYDSVGGSLHNVLMYSRVRVTRNAVFVRPMKMYLATAFINSHIVHNTINLIDKTCPKCRFLKILFDPF